MDVNRMWKNKRQQAWLERTWLERTWLERAWLERAYETQNKIITSLPGGSAQLETVSAFANLNLRCPRSPPAHIWKSIEHLASAPHRMVRRKRNSIFNAWWHTRHCQYKHPSVDDQILLTAQSITSVM